MIAYFQNLDVFEDEDGLAIAIEDEVAYLTWEEVKALGGLLIQTWQENQQDRGRN